MPTSLGDPLVLHGVVYFTWIGLTRPVSAVGAVLVGVVPLVISLSVGVVILVIRSDVIVLQIVRFWWWEETNKVINVTCKASVWVCYYFDQFDLDHDTWPKVQIRVRRTLLVVNFWGLVESASIGIFICRIIHKGECLRSCNKTHLHVYELVEIYTLRVAVEKLKRRWEVSVGSGSGGGFTTWQFLFLFFFYTIVPIEFFPWFATRWSFVNNKKYLLPRLGILVAVLRILT